MRCTEVSNRPKGADDAHTRELARTCSSRSWYVCPMEIAACIPLIKSDLPVLEETEQQFREVLLNGRITNFDKYVRAFEEESIYYSNAKWLKESTGLRSRNHRDIAGPMEALSALRPFAIA